MRKLNQLCSKMLEELSWRARACMTYLETEQKIQNDDHRMYPEHQELLPWVLSQLPADIQSR